ncbi:uncharacterized protein LOC124646962 [Lolium rigidum]|uniref:uncharacterized protein LOC124646962 n=1 Tax=Lolium rigidum TaxID=89674 RepID=UPI001F5C8BD7|nr:uncharacterized protein LOC124646962 [Lolium rigidum]
MPELTPAAIHGKDAQYRPEPPNTPQLQPPAHMLPRQQGHRPSLSQLTSMPGSMPGPSPVNPALPSMAHPMKLMTLLIQMGTSLSNGISWSGPQMAILCYTETLSSLKITIHECCERCRLSP